MPQVSHSTLNGSQPRHLMVKTVEGYLVTPCVYCGMAAEGRDHFVPRSWRHLMQTWRTGIWKDAPDTVPACQQCNSIAGAKVFATIADKRDHIKRRLRQKYAKLLSTPFQTEDELAELGPTLRSHVDARETKRLRLLYRLAWPYKVEKEVESLTQLLYREADAETALNTIRRREILS